jgi:hypothetical protein
MWRRIWRFDVELSGQRGLGFSNVENSNPLSLTYRPELFGELAGPRQGGKLLHDRAGVGALLA